MTEFKAGDRVVINTDDPHHTESSINFRRGDEGVVSAHPVLGAVDTDGDIRVTFNGNRWAWVSPECLSKVGEPEASDNPIEPNHYQRNGVNFIEFIEHLPGNRFNAMKYIFRAGEKNPETLLEDLKKGQWSLNREIARLEALSA